MSTRFRSLIERLEARIAPAFASIIRLPTLDGVTGFTISGLTAGDRAGFSVSDAGDVNGDGFGDLIIGARGAAGGAYNGAAYVVFGKAGGFPAAFDLSTLNGANGFAITGEATGDRLGAGVGTAGDLNGDGFDDLIVGAGDAARSSGASYVIFGKTNGFAPAFDLSTLNGANGFKIQGGGTLALGYAVTTAGDVNGDGFDDLLLGAGATGSNYGNGSGVSYLIFGRAAGFGPALDLSGLNGTNGFKMSGQAAYSHFGGAVSTAGDVNGDGFADLIIGALGSGTGGLSGSAYVVFGQSGGFGATFNPASLNGSNGFKISGVAAGDRLGASVSAAGDVNGDGIDDLLIGASDADPNGLDSGASYVVFGKTGGFAAALNVSALNGTNGFKINGAAPIDRAGGSVSGAGDVNADGFDDLFIGALGAGSNAGASYLVFGGGSAFTAPVELSTLNGANGFTIIGAGGRDLAGIVSTAGDVNGDGFDDLLIGATYADPRGESSGASYVVFGGPTATLAIGDASVSEGNAGASDLTFTVNLSAQSTVPVTVRYSTQNGTAEAGNDFSSVTNQLLTFAPGETSKTITVAIAGDTTYEADETLAVVLSGATNATVTDDAGVGTIRNDEVGVLIAGPVNLTEGDSGTTGFAFAVSLDKPSEVPVTVNYTTADGTALAGNDYTALTLGTLTFAPGETAKTIAVNLLGDTSIEAHETFSVLLADATNATILSGTATGTILNDDTAVAIVGPVSVVEGNSGTTGLVFTVSMERPSALFVTVNYTAADGTAMAGSDYTALTPGTLTFAPGEMAKSITVEVRGEPLYESDETFSVVLSDSANAVLTTPTSLGTIRNDDAPPTVSISSVATVEGNVGISSLIFSVSLSTASGIPATVNYSTADGFAQAGNDFAAAAAGALVTFAPGETSKVIMIDVHGDASAEDHENFSVILSDASGATIVAGTATGTILNDDTVLGISDADSIVEGDSATKPVFFTVTLEKVSALPVTVSYATAAGTSNVGSDFMASAAQLSFAPGETSKIIAVDVVGDTSIEAHEAFSVILSAPANATIGHAIGVGTILNDEAALWISDAPPAIEDGSGASGIIFTVTLEQPSALPVTVSYATSEGTASTGSDFTGIGAQLTFAPGETVKTITVDVTGDTSIEANETFSLFLSDPTNATIGSGTATGTILNDDTSVRLGDATLLEGHSGTRGLTFAVSLTAASALPVTMKIEMADGTATSFGSDFFPFLAFTLTFAPGETSQTITVDVLGDTIVEPTETFSVLLSDVSNAVIDDATGVGTILDDDVLIVGERKATFIDVDGDLATITVSKGRLVAGNFTLVPSGLGSQLALVDFSGDTGRAHTNLTIAAKRAPGGDGLVNVGFVDAGGIDLGKVLIKGDLGRIDAGDETVGTPALASLSANSLGRRGLDTQLPGGSMRSEIFGKLGTLKLTNDMGDASLLASGDIGAVTIKGGVLGSTIRSDGRIGVIKISGDLAASATNAATISAQGNLSPTSSATALAIASLSISGSVDHAQILAGYDRTGTAVNGDSGIGAVTVARDWIASSLIAGVTAGPDSLFGTDDDAPIARATSIISKIASIVIKGTAAGTEVGSDHFGFVARQIGAFKAGGAKLALIQGASNDLAGLPVGTIDLHVREVV